jgi:hypothetical protein
VEQDGLRLRIWCDFSDGTCELEATAQSKGFGGTGSAWFDIAEVRSFAESLAKFPIGEAARRGISGGYFDSQGLERLHLALSAKQIDSAGHIALQVRVATALERTARPESQHLAQLEIRTTYETLRRFARQLRSLTDGSTDEAVLLADPG